MGCEVTMEQNSEEEKKMAWGEGGGSPDKGGGLFDDRFGRVSLWEIRTL